MSGVRFRLLPQAPPLPPEALFATVFPPSRRPACWVKAMANPATGYSVVYHIEIALLFATLIAIGPLVRRPGLPGFRLGELSSHSLSLPR